MFSSKTETKTEKTFSTGDFTSAEAIVGRFKEAIDDLSKRTDTELDSSDIQRSLAVLLNIVQHPTFLVQSSKRRQGFVRKVLPSSSSSEEKDESTTDPSYLGNATNDELKALLPYLDLANIAYELETKTLELQLKSNDHNYILIRHYKTDDVGDVNHYIAFDPTCKELLIGVRGTGSISDVITDVVAANVPHTCTPYCPFTGEEKEKEIRCHEGMYTAALGICNAVSPLIEHLYIPLGYKIKIVGHSLGAGAASLLAVLLRSKYIELQEPNKLHAYCFATPAVLNLEIASSCKDFITSVINDQDCVPRLSLANMGVFVKMIEKLNEKILKELELDSWWSLAKQKWSNNQEKFACDDNMMGKMKDIVQTSQNAVSVDDPGHLFAPGKIIFMYPYIDPNSKQQIMEKSTNEEGVEVPLETDNKNNNNESSTEESTTEDKIDGYDVLFAADFIEPMHREMRMIRIGMDMVNHHMTDSIEERLKKCIS